MNRAVMGMGIAAVLGVAAALFFAPQKAIAGEKGGITIWEVCSVNRGSFRDQRGETPDWIEVKNTADEPVNLAGFMLGDGRTAEKQAPLPEVELKPGECILLCASGQTGWDGANYHLPFRLSSEGELLLLSAPDGRVVQLIYIPSMAAEESYGMTEKGTMEKMQTPTPGEANAPVQPGYQAAPMGWVEGRR